MRILSLTTLAIGLVFVSTVCASPSSSRFEKRGHRCDDECESDHAPSGHGSGFGAGIVLVIVQNYC
jgi:hypothetical protein